MKWKNPAFGVEKIKNMASVCTWTYLCPSIAICTCEERFPWRDRTRTYILYSNNIENCFVMYLSNLVYFFLCFSAKNGFIRSFLQNFSLARYFQTFSAFPLSRLKIWYRLFLLERLKKVVCQNMNAVFVIWRYLWKDFFQLSWFKEILG